jgi:Ser/Thr protein kinase RdoA (MazF antagonist)
MSLRGAQRRSNPDPGGDRPADRDYLVTRANRLREESEVVCPQLSTGFCHGDAWSGNAHLTSGAVTFFDFDCGGQGWRSDDLAVLVYGQAALDVPDRAAHCGAFLDGYESQRSVSSADFDAIPLFVLLRQIWHMGLHAAGIENWGSDWIDDAYFVKRVDNLRRWDERRLCELLPKRRC